MEQNLGNELSAWQYWFYMNDKGPTAKETPQTLWTTFQPILREALIWARASTNVRNDRPSGLRFASVSLAKTSWLKKDRQLVAVGSRTLNDVFYIQTALAKQGAASLLDVEAFKKASWEAARPREAFLGRAVCLWLEIPPATLQDHAAQLMRELMDEWSGSAGSEIEQIETNFGTVGLSATSAEPLWVLLVHDREESRRKASRLLDWLLPQFFAAVLKIRDQTESIETILQKAHSLEAKVVAATAKPMPKKLSDMERYCERLSRLQMQYAEHINEIESRLAGLEINALNAAALFRDDTFVVDESKLHMLLFEPLQRPIQQTKADLRYLALTQARVQNAMQNALTVAQIGSTAWSRRLTILFGLVTILGLLQLFPEFTANDNYLRERTLFKIIALVVLLGIFGLSYYLWGVIKKIFQKG